jgi:hypothetical protein
VAPEPLAPILAPKNVSRSTFFEFYGDRGYDAMALPGTVLRGGDLGSRNPQKAVCRFLQSAPKCGLKVQFAADSPLEEAGFELSVPPERKAALDRVRRPSVTRRQA